MRRIVTRCLWGLVVLALMAILVLSSALIGTTIVAALAPPDAPAPALRLVPLAAPQPGLAIVNTDPH